MILSACQRRGEIGHPEAVEVARKLKGTRAKPSKARATWTHHADGSACSHRGLLLQTVADRSPIQDEGKQCHEPGGAEPAAQVEVQASLVQNSQVVGF